MDKYYIVNYDVSGIKRVEIDDERLLEGEGKTVIVALDKNTSDKLNIYYNNILNIITSRNKLILIIIGDGSSIDKQICNLMALYRQYNIYKIDDTNILDIDYIRELDGREPSYNEVQTFIGGDISAYSDINKLLIEIEELIIDGNIADFKNIVESNRSTLKKLRESVDYMKSRIDNIDSGSLNDEEVEKVKELDNIIQNVKKELDKVREGKKSTEEENNKLRNDIEKYKEEMDKMKSKISKITSLQGEEIGYPIIKTYTQLNTALINCKVKIVIYFKEITYVSYINSLIEALIKSIKLRELRVKMIIYDNDSGLSSIYKPLHVVKGREYMTRRSEFISKTEKFVVIEPNPVILEDILTYNSNPYDVLIVYDRMKQVEDLIVGNNVFKFFVVNSSKDYNDVKEILKINDVSSVITRQDSNIGKDVLDIPTIKDYSGSTDTAKLSKYMKLMTCRSKKPLIQTILDKSKIEDIR